MPETRTFAFRLHGHAYHLVLDGPSDLRWAVELDAALWVANSASIETINADEVLLDYLDPNDDNRIHADDVKEAVRWMLGRLSDLANVREGNTTLRLTDLSTADDEGRRIELAATKILARVGAEDRDVVTLDQVRRTKKEAIDRGLSDAGIVLPTATDDEDVRAFLADIVATVGGADHHGGDMGVTDEHLKRFLDEARTYVAWLDRAELRGETTSTAMPLGEATHDAYALLSGLREKVAQFFDLCRTTCIDPTVADRVWAGGAIPESMDLADGDAVAAYLGEAPLSRPNPDGRLDPRGELNPVFAPQLARFHAEIMQPLEAGNRLDPGEWAQIEARFRAHEAWFEARPDVAVDGLAEDRLRRYVDDPRYLHSTLELIAASHRTALDLEEVRLLERLILFQGWMMPLVNSYVSFPDLYDPERRALFEMGTLVMDGRHFKLAVRVLDREQHKRLSAASNVFVLFVEVSDREGQALYEVAVPVTAGGRGNLTVGKRGLFIDTDGRQLHAKVIHIVENPISFREAMVSPLLRMGQAITGKLEQMQSAAEDKIELFGVGTVTRVEQGSAPAEAPPQAAAPATGSMLAGGGIALAALGSSGAFVLKTLAGMELWTILGVLFALSQAVLLPILAVAWIKLRRRDLSSILEGSGWGINARMRLTRGQAVTFTRRPPFPPGSTGIHSRVWWAWVLVALMVIAIFVGVGVWQGLF